MKSILLLSLLPLLAASSMSAAETSPVYELRTYTVPPGKMENLLARFRDHSVEILARHGMISVGYWLPMDAKDGAGDKLIYMLRHPSRAAAARNWAEFKADPEWQAVAAASQVHGKIVDKVVSVFLEAADYCPPLPTGSAPGGPGIFELRIYTTPEGKLPALDARFRHPERTYFVRHGMREIGYFHPLDTDQGAGHTLVYMLGHASREAAAASWAGFRGDPDWIALKAETEKNGALTVKIESIFLRPTDFSALK